MRTWWTPRNSVWAWVMMAREGSALRGRGCGEGTGAGGVAEVDDGGAPAAPVAGDLVARVGAEGEAHFLAGPGGEIGFDGDPATVERLGAGVDGRIEDDGRGDEHLETDAVAEGGVPGIGVECERG